MAVVLAAALTLMGGTESMARAHYERIHERHHHAHQHAHQHARQHAQRGHHHHRGMKKVASIAAPIAIGAAFGPAGSVGYQVIKHRKAIRRHLFHRG